MVAELIAVGSELLTPHRRDTNTLWLTEQLNARGIYVARKSVVGDDHEALKKLFRSAGRRSEMVIACGGLGPTFDDVTREALAEALGLELKYHAEIFGRIEALYRRRGLVPTDNNRRQAMVPEGALYFKNNVGTAPGLLVRRGGVTYALLPGPPAELQAVFFAMAAELFAGVDTEPVFSRQFKLFGIPESAIDARLRDFPSTPGIEWSILASYGQVEIHLRARAKSEAMAQRAFESAGAELRGRFGANIFGTDAETLESVVVGLLRRNGHTLATAESCTGGWLARRITDVPGSSECFWGGVVSYHNEAKEALLGVARETLERHGAVSRATALEMARQVRERSGSDVGAAITGVAGPGGGTEDKPVGTVYISAVSADGAESCHRHLFPGDRETIRFQATQAALAMIREPYVDGEFENMYIIDEKGGRSGTD